MTLNKIASDLIKLADELHTDGQLTKSQTLVALAKALRTKETMLTTLLAKSDAESLARAREAL